MMYEDRFKHHEPCPACRERGADRKGNNLGRYFSGSAYCFACGYSESSRLSPYVQRAERRTEVQGVRVPEDCSTSYGQSAIEWVSKYGISVEELIKRDVLWSDKWQQLIFTFYDESRNLLIWQGRNFIPELAKKRKYYSQGDINNVLPIYTSNLRVGDAPGNDSSKKLHRLIIVEDCISAIKIARWCDCMPVLGSTLSLSKITRLRPFYDVLEVFLDGNMFHKAQTAASNAKMLGFEARAIYHDLDPKEIEEDELRVLTNCNEV